MYPFGGSRNDEMRRFCRIAAAILALPNALRTAHRTGMWVRSVFLKQRALAALSVLAMLAVASAADTDEPWAYTAPAARRPTEAVDTAPLLERVSSIYSNALQALARGDMADAQQLITEALNIAPSAPALRRSAVRIYNDVGSHGLALEMLNDLLAEFPGQPELLAERSGTYLLLGDEKRAEKDLRRAIRAAPASLTVLYYEFLMAIRHQDTAAASRAVAGLTGAQVLEFCKRMQLERSLIERITSASGYADAVRILFSLPPDADTEAILPRVTALLEQLRPLMGKADYAGALPVLQQIRKAGAGNPGLFYDVAMTAYLLNPSEKRLDQLVDFATSEKGAAFARFSIYLCLYARDAERAQRIADVALKDARDQEALLIRAALAYNRESPDAGWKILAQIPPVFRPPASEWFRRDLPAIQAIRQDPRYEAWVKNEI